jgi:VanZ family protein
MTSLRIASTLHRRIWIIVWCACVGGIWWLSSMPHPPSPLQDIEFHDKLEHILAFFCVGMSGGIALYANTHRTMRVVILTAVIFAVIYGFTDEVHQAFVPNRSVSVLDWFADCCGALLAGYGLIKVLPHIRTDPHN